MKKIENDIEDLRKQLHIMLDEDAKRKDIYQLSLKLDKLLEQIIDNRSFMAIEK